MSAVLQEMTWDHSSSDAPDVTPRIHDRVFDQMWSFVPQLRGYLRHRLSPMEADDVIQDIFLRLVQCASCQTVAFPKSYLFETAHAVLIDRRRRAASRCAFMHCELTESHHPTDELSPLRVLLAREEVRAVEAVINTLPPRTQEIILAIRLEGASLKSLAERHQISTSAVEKHIGRALRALSTAVAEDAPVSSACPAARDRTNRKQRPAHTPTTTAARISHTSQLRSQTLSMEMR